MVTDPFAGVPTAGEQPQAEQSGPRAATRKQVEFIRSLAEDKQMDDEHRTSILVRVTHMELFYEGRPEDERFAYLPSDMPGSFGISFDRAQEWIPRLKSLPRRPQDTGDARKGKLVVTYHDIETDRGEQRIGFLYDGAQYGDDEHKGIPAGRYALDTSGDPFFSNDITFFKLWIGTRYGWAIKVQHSDEVTELAKGTQVAVARRIMANPAEASARYGQHIGACGVCGRTLTNDLSRQIGIGPVCRDKMGW